MKKKQQITIADYLAVVMKNRRFILRNVIAVALMAAAISLLIPQKFTSTATILPPNPEQEAMFGFIPGLSAGGLSSRMSGLMGGLVPSLSTPSDLYAAIMTSGRIKGRIIRKYNLKREFKARTNYDASKALDEITKVEVSPEGIISVSVIYTDKELATDIANSYVEELDKFNTETAMTTGKKYRIFIEERLKETIDTLSMTEEKLRAFQEKHRTIALDIEVEQAIATIAELKSQIILLEVKKGALSSSSYTSNPYLYSIDRELRELKKQLQKIEFGTQDKDSMGFGAGFAVPFSELPELSLEYARLLRDVTVQGAIYELLTQQYEQAKIMELKDTPTIQFLDRAGIPEKRTSPKRAIIVILATIISFLANIPLVFLLDYLADIRTNPGNHTFAVKLSSDISQDFNALMKHINKILQRK